MISVYTCVPCSRVVCHKGPPRDFALPPKLPRSVDLGVCGADIGTWVVVILRLSPCSNLAPVFTCTGLYMHPSQSPA